MSDAKFEDGAEKPLSLMAEDADDLQVIATLTQDAVFPVGEIRWHASQRQFALLLNRFRWEDRAQAEQRARGYERVQSVLLFDDVQAVAGQGVSREDPDVVLSLLSISFEPGEDGTGTVTLTLAGDGALRLQVEALNVTLRDVTRPYLAPSGQVPEHD